MPSSSPSVARRTARRRWTWVRRAWSEAGRGRFSSCARGRLHVDSVVGASQLDGCRRASGEVTAEGVVEAACAVARVCGSRPRSRMRRCLAARADKRCHAEAIRPGGLGVDGARAGVDGPRAGACGPPRQGRPCFAAVETPRPLRISKCVGQRNRRAIASAWVVLLRSHRSPSSACLRRRSGLDRPGTLFAVGSWLFVSWAFGAYVGSLGNYALYYGSLATAAVTPMALPDEPLAGGRVATPGRGALRPTGCAKKYERESRQAKLPREESPRI